MGTTLIANNSLKCPKLFDVASLSIQIQSYEVVSFVYISVKVPVTGSRHPMRRGVPRRRRHILSSMLCCRSAFLRFVCLMPSDLHISCKFLLSIPLLMTRRSTGSTLRGPPPIEAILCDRSS